MAVLQRVTGEPAGSIFIFNFAAANFTMASELELMAALHHQRNGGDFGFLERIPEKSTGCVDSTPTHNICAVQFVHKRGTRTTRLAQGRPGSRIALSSLCA